MTPYLRLLRPTTLLRMTKIAKEIEKVKKMQRTYLLISLFCHVIIHIKKHFPVVCRDYLGTFKRVFGEVRGSVLFGHQFECDSRPDGFSFG